MPCVKTVEEILEKPKKRCAPVPLPQSGNRSRKKAVASILPLAGSYPADYSVPVCKPCDPHRASVRYRYASPVILAVISLSSGIPSKQNRIGHTGHFLDLVYWLDHSFLLF